MPPDAGGFEYFMLRVVQIGDSSENLTGQVERLGTGEKRRFDTGPELLALVTQWPVSGMDSPPPTVTGRQ